MSETMTSTWNDLASSLRWRGVISFIRNWVGPFDSDQGMQADELDLILREKSLKLPVAVHEWYLLAAHWHQGGLNVWKRPNELALSEGVVWVLTDSERINHWGIRVSDLDQEDPPVVSFDAHPPNSVDFPEFSRFVAAMIINDFIFDFETEEPMELKRDHATKGMTCLVAARCGQFLMDGPLESTAIVIFAYPENGSVFGRSRSPAGRARLQLLRLQEK